MPAWIKSGRFCQTFPPTRMESIHYPDQRGTENWFKAQCYHGDCGHETQLTHGENFQGILVGPILRKIEKATQEGFEKMNLALKEKAEK